MEVGPHSELTYHGVMSNLGLSTAGDLICKTGMLELQIDLSFGYLE